MEQNRMLLNLMQNVVDKLDEITSMVNTKQESSFDEHVLKTISTCPKLISNFTNELLKNREVFNKLIARSDKQIKETIVNNKPVNHTHQKKEYILFGNDTPFTSRLFLMIILAVLITSFSFKYIPNYVLERSEIKNEREQYKLFYKYVYLNAYNNEASRANYVVSTFNKIRDKDSTLMNYINRIAIKHDKAIKIEELKDQIKTLNAKK